MEKAKKPYNLGSVSPTPTLSPVFLTGLASATVAQSEHEPTGLEPTLRHHSVEVTQRTPRLSLKAGPLAYFHATHPSWSRAANGQNTHCFCGESLGVHVYLSLTFLGQTPYSSRLWRRYIPFAFGSYGSHQPSSFHVAVMAPEDLFICGPPFLAYDICVSCP